MTNSFVWKGKCCRFVLCALFHKELKHIYNLQSDKLQCPNSALSILVVERNIVFANMTSIASFLKKSDTNLHDFSACVFLIALRYNALNKGFLGSEIMSSQTYLQIPFLSASVKSLQCLLGDFIHRQRG